MMGDEKKEIKLDISSKAIETGIEGAKNFAEKLVLPSTEELGLLVRDQISFWRFRNQVKILNKAKEICERNKISVKAIAPKLLVPYLENASLEDDNDLQDKWAALLANMADSENNIQNQVFPYILSQLSKEEFKLLEDVYLIKRVRVKKIKEEQEEHLNNKPSLIGEQKAVINHLENEFRQENENKPNYSQFKRSEIYLEIKKAIKRIDDINSQDRFYEIEISRPQEIEEKYIKKFEIANIVRLGLAKVVYEAFADSQTLEIPGTEPDRYRSVKLDINIQTDTSTIMTELGELFIEACQERNQESHKY